MMHLVTLTVPSTMSNFTMSHAAPDHDLQTMLQCQIQALQLAVFSRKPPHIRVDLVANRQEVLSSLTIIFSHILQFQLMYMYTASEHQSSAASYVPCRTQTELQAPATSCY